MERASAPREWCIELGESLTDTNRSDARASRKARGEHTKHFSNCGESQMCQVGLGERGRRCGGTYETFEESATLVARTIRGVSGRDHYSSLRIACPGHNPSIRMGSQWGADLLPGTWTKGRCKHPASQILSNIIYNDEVVRTVIIIPVIRVGTRKRLGIVPASVVVQHEEVRLPLPVFA